MEPIGSLANDEKLAAEAMMRIAPDAAALSTDEFLQVNLDLQQATSTILGVIPEVMALRDRIAKELSCAENSLARGESMAPSGTPSL